MGAIFLRAFYNYNLCKIPKMGEMSGILSANLFENIFALKIKGAVR